MLLSVFYAQIKHARLIWVKCLNDTSFDSETKFDLAYEVKATQGIYVGYLHVVKLESPMLHGKSHYHYIYLLLRSIF